MPKSSDNCEYHTYALLGGILVGSLMMEPYAGRILWLCLMISEDTVEGIWTSLQTTGTAVELPNPTISALSPILHRDHTRTITICAPRHIRTSTPPKAEISISYLPPT